MRREGALNSQSEKLPGVSARIWPGLWSFLLVGLILIVILLLKPWQLEIRAARAAASDPAALVVMPLEGCLDSSYPASLGKILSELLIIDLSDSYYIHVVSSQRRYEFLQAVERPQNRLTQGDHGLDVAVKAGARWLVTGRLVQKEGIARVELLLREVTSEERIAELEFIVGSDESVTDVADRITASLKHRLMLASAVEEEKDQPVAMLTTESVAALEAYLTGVNWYRQGHHKEANTCFQRALGYDSGYAMPYYFLSELEEDDLIHLATEFSEHSTHQERLFICSRDALHAGDSVQAIDYLQELVDHYPREIDARFNLAILELGQGMDTAAIANLRKTVEIDTNFVRGYRALAGALDRYGCLDEAREAMIQAVRLSPHDAELYEAAGDLAASHGRLQEASRFFTKARELDPDRSSTGFKLFAIALDGGDYDRADSLRLTLATPTDSVTEALASALTEARQGRLERALSLTSTVEKMIQAKPDSLPEHHLRLRTVLLKVALRRGRGQDDLARREIKAQLNKNDRWSRPELQRLHLLRIRLLSETGDLAGAEAALIALGEEGILSTSGNWHAAGVVALARGENDLAILLLRAAAKEGVSLRDFDLTYDLGRASLAAGDPDSAVIIFGSLISTFSVEQVWHPIRSVTAHYLLGLALEETGQRRAAAAQYRTFLDIWDAADSHRAEYNDASRRLRLLRGQS